MNWKTGVLPHPYSISLCKRSTDLGEWQWIIKNLIMWWLHLHLWIHCWSKSTHALETGMHQLICFFSILVSKDHQKKLTLSRLGQQYIFTVPPRTNFPVLCHNLDQRVLKSLSSLQYLMWIGAGIWWEGVVVASDRSPGSSFNFWL